MVRQHQQFYSSPSGSRLKVLPQPQPGTPSRALINTTGLQTHGLPTPISHHTTGITLRQAPPSPTPHGEDQSSSEDSDDDVPPPPASFPRRITPFGHQQARPSKRSAFRADSQLSFAPGHQPAPQARPEVPRAQARQAFAPPSRSLDPSGSHVPPTDHFEEPFRPDVLLGEGLPVTRMGKEQQIGRWCEMHVLKCSVCLFRGIEARHFPYSCPSGVLRTPNYMTYKKGLRFTTNGLCYGCLVPDSVHKKHARPNPNSRFTCLYDDQMRPLAYLIFEHKDIFKAVTRAMGLKKKFLNREDYTLWLAQQEPHPEAVINLQEIVIVYMNLKLNSRLPRKSSFLFHHTLLTLLQKFSSYG